MPPAVWGTGRSSLWICGSLHPLGKTGWRQVICPSYFPSYLISLSLSFLPPSHSCRLVSLKGVTPPMLSAYAGSVLVKRCASHAYSRHGRAMLASNLVEEVGVIARELLGEWKNTVCHVQEYNNYWEKDTRKWYPVLSTIIYYALQTHWNWCDQQWIGWATKWLLVEMEIHCALLLSRGRGVFHSAPNGAHTSVVCQVRDCSMAVPPVQYT